MPNKLLSCGLPAMLILAVALAGCGGRTTSTPTESDLINSLLDQYQSGVVNESVDLIASLCTYPFYWEGKTFVSAVELIAYWDNLLDTVKGYDVYEFSSRIITVNEYSATVDAYLHQVISYKDGNTQNNTTPVKITVIKVNGIWKIPRIEPSTDIEKCLINNLLDQYQTAMKNKDTDTLVSLCAFPFNNEGTQYNDASAMKTAYQTEFSQIESINNYEIINRDIIVIGSESGYNSAYVFASVHLKQKFQSGTTLDYTYACQISAIKVDGVWKVRGIVKS